MSIGEVGMMDGLSPYRLVFEILTYLLFGLSVADARRRGWPRVGELVTALLFGLTLEWATIQQLHAYRYGRFLVMVTDEVPLVVGAGWSVIIYAARLYAEESEMARWLRPIFTALLALNIDLSMDTLAIRLGMWDWGQGLHFQYFGVPWANFWAWFWVVFSFSSALVWTERWIASPFGRWLRLPLAFFVGVGGVLASNRFIVSVIPWKWHPWFISLFLLTALVIVLASRPRLPWPVPTVARAVPFTFHTVFILIGLISGVIFHPPVLLLIASLMLGIAWLLYECACGKGESL